MSALHGSHRALPWIRRALLIAGLAAGLALVPISLSGEASADQVERMRDELDATRSRIRQLQLDTSERALRIDALRNDERAIEEIARDELGMVFPGEVVYHLEPSRASE